MKKRVSATIDEKTDREIDRILRQGKHRNRSHVIEDAIKLLSEEING